MTPLLQSNVVLDVSSLKAGDYYYQVLSGVTMLKRDLFVKQ